MKKPLFRVLAPLAILLGANTEAAALPEYYFHFTPATQSSVAGETGAFTITMNKPYDVGDAIFAITSSDATRVSVPATLAVPKGLTTATGSFTSLKAGGPVTLKATQPAALGSKSESITVQVTGAAVDAGAEEEPGATQEPPSATGSKPAEPSSPAKDDPAPAEASSSGGCQAAVETSSEVAPFVTAALAALALVRRRGKASGRAA